METVITTDIIEGAAGIINFHACTIADGGEGACLMSVAILCYQMEHRHGITLTAHRGEFDGMAHWWAEHEGVIIDPTATQFGEHPLMVREDEAGRAHYAEFESFPQGWKTQSLVVAEAERAFAFPGAAAGFVERTLFELDDMANAVERLMART